MTFQIVQLVRQRVDQQITVALQETAVQHGAQVRKQLAALSGATAKLAASGSADARSVIETLRSQGVTIELPQKKD